MSPAAAEPPTLAALRRHGWLLLRDRPAGDLVRVAGQLAQQAPAWPEPIGRVTAVEAEMRERPSPYAPLRQGAVAFHNDGMHLRHPPRLLLLQCEIAPSEGGETLLVRGQDALHHLSSKTMLALRATALRVRTGDFETLRPLVAPHPDDGDEVLQFFDPMLADDGEVSGEGAPALLDAVRRALYVAPAYVHTWTVGDLLVIDNLRTLHGRADYRGQRRLRRLPVGPYLGAAAWA